MTIKNQIPTSLDNAVRAVVSHGTDLPGTMWWRIAMTQLRNALNQHPSNDPTEKVADAMAVLRQWGAENGANYFDAQARSRRKWDQTKQTS